MTAERPRHLALLGPTACGKSALALGLARGRPGIELVSVDSMQVYRGMDVGTAKPTSAERAEVPHHLIDLAEVGERCTVARFAAAAAEALAGIEHRGNTAVLVGGTGLYLRAILGDLTPPGEYPAVRAELEASLAEGGTDLDVACARFGGSRALRAPDGDPVRALYRRLIELDPVAASRIEPANARRIVRALEVTIGSGRRFSDWGPGMAAYEERGRFAMVGVWLPRAVVAERIGRRVDAMLDAGLVTEVRALAARRGGFGPTARQALGYAEMLGHVEQGRDLRASTAQMVQRTRQFSQRQRRWFRRDPRIRWHGTSADPRRLLAGLVVELARCGPDRA